MFDDEDDYGISTSHDDDADDFDYYVSFIRALEDEMVEKALIVQELMDEFDLEQAEAVKILKRYYKMKAENEDDEDEYHEDIVDDDDYGDGNSTDN